MDLHDINKLVHIGSGVAALILGQWALWSLKGGATHRRFGTLYVWAGVFNLGAALIGVIFFDPPPALAAAFVAAAYQYLSSLRSLALKTRGPGWIEAGLVLAGVAACGYLWLNMGPGTKSWSPAIGYSTIGYTLFLCAYDTSRYLWAKAWLRSARPLDHGLKMTGAYFAMMSAGVGNIFRDFQPWSQVGPSMLGVVVMLVLTVGYLTREGRAGKPA